MRHEKLRKVVDEQPDFLNGWVLLTDVLEKLGRVDEAREAHSKESNTDQTICDY